MGEGALHQCGHLVLMLEMNAIWQRCRVHFMRNVLAQAGWHAAADLVVPDDVTLLTLPSHAPERNPVETRWQFMRQNWLGTGSWAYRL